MLEFPIKLNGYLPTLKLLLILLVMDNNLSSVFISWSTQDNISVSSPHCHSHCVALERAKTSVDSISDVTSLYTFHVPTQYFLGKNYKVFIGPWQDEC